jgi:hypothetical protein
MNRTLATILACTLAVPALALAAGGGQTQLASISGTASNTSGQSLASATVQLRNLATGQIAGTTTSNTVGNFAFVGINPGNYIVEVVNAAGQIAATSASITVAAGATVTGVAVTTVTAITAGTAGAAGAAVAAGAAGGASVATAVTAAAAAAGVTGAVVAVNDASPSQ